MPTYTQVTYHYRWFGPEFWVTVILVALLVALVLFTRWAVRSANRWRHPGPRFTPGAGTDAPPGTTGQP